MNSTSFAFTSWLVAVSDSHKISFRTVRSRHWSGVKSASDEPAIGAAEVTDAAGEILADVNLPVRVGDLVDDLHWPSARLPLTFPSARAGPRSSSEAARVGRTSSRDRRPNLWRIIP
jgi:hypothetical protein